MDKKHEVEFRALIDRSQFDSILKKARSDGLFVKDPVVIEDYYFCAQSVKGFEEIEMDKPGSYSLRLRREINNGNALVDLNTKTMTKQGDHNAWLEHETGVSSFDDMQEMLSTIGFKVFFSLKKKRYRFDQNGVRVCLEDIEDFQPVIEVEILTTQDGTEAAKSILLAFLEMNGVKKDAVVKKSVTNILMREKSKF